jgi:3-hydroxyisobutyrate dehydrogenase-like beta-hydroxyacid dehydrogenase
MTTTPIAFLGTGLMGAPMARNLLRAGFLVTCYNRTPERTGPVVEAGGVAHPTPAGAAREASVVISCVTDGPDVERVLLGPEGAARSAPPGALFIDMSTIAPATAVRVGAELRDRGFRFLEAPVTGSTQGAEQGTLRIMAGGARPDFEEARPVLAALGTKVTYCGGPGAGQAVKLCNQIMIALNLLGVCEALTLCRALGADPATLVEALDGGSATSWALQNLAPKINAGDFAPGFRVDMVQKDMRLVAEAAEAAGAALPGTALSQQLWRSAQAHGDGQEGIQALYKVLARLSAAAVVEEV